MRWGQPGVRPLEHAAPRPSPRCRVAAAQRRTRWAGWLDDPLCECESIGTSASERYEGQILQGWTHRCCLTIFLRPHGEGSCGARVQAACVDDATSPLTAWASLHARLAINKHSRQGVHCDTCCSTLLTSCGAHWTSRRSLRREARTGDGNVRAKRAPARSLRARYRLGLSQPTPWFLSWQSSLQVYLIACLSFATGEVSSHADAGRRAGPASGHALLFNRPSLLRRARARAGAGPGAPTRAPSQTRPNL